MPLYLRLFRLCACLLGAQWLQATTHLPVAPIVFEPGTVAGEYLSQTAQGFLRLTSQSIELAAQGRPTIRMSLVGAKMPIPVAENRLPSLTHYFSGNDESSWRRGVANFAQVRYSDVYPGIDLVFHEAGGQDGRSLEYDFVVQAGADPSKIRLHFENAGKLQINSAGDIVSLDGHFYQKHLRVLQDGREVSGRFVLHADSSIGFRFGRYDHKRPLTIDPVVTYASYLGGEAFETISSIAVDAAGNVIVAGNTLSLRFPGSGIFARGDLAQVAFVSKFAPIVGGKTQLMFTAFLRPASGRPLSIANAVAVDSAGNIVVAGVMVGNGFPTRNAFQTVNLDSEDCATRQGGTVRCEDAFLSKLSPDGGNLIFSTLYGGKYSNRFTALALDAAGGIYAAGNQSGDDGITDLRGTTNSYQPGATSSTDMILTRWSPAGALLYATYFGTASGADTATSIAVERPGVVWFGGNTSSPNMPMPLNNNGLQSRYTALRSSGYIGRLDMNLSGTSALTYSSYFNGTINNTAIAQIFVDPSASVVFCGSTTSDIPFTETRLQNYAGFNPARSTGAEFTSGDAFIARINPAIAGTAGLTYSSWVGGSDVDFAASCGLDARGNFVVAGGSLSLQFLASGSPVPYRLGLPGASGISGFLIRIDPTRQQGRVDTILFGGSGSDIPTAMAIDSKGFAYLGGSTDSKLYPFTANAVQPTYGGDTLTYAAGACCGDAFLMQADLNAEQVAVAALQSAGSEFLFGNPGAASPVTLSARLIDANGNPLALPGYIIEFKATNAQLAQSTALTDGSGVAKTTAQITGMDATVAVTSVSLPNLAPLNLRIRSTTTALPRSVAIVSGDKQIGRAGSALGQPLVIEMRDANNAPLAIAGFTIQLRLVNATASSANLVTDNAGRVSTNITLGPLSGGARVEVLLGTLAPVTATYTVSGGRPSITSGGVVSAASFQSGGVSPGLIVTLFGTGIGPDALAIGGADESGKFPTELGGTTVLFDGVPAPVVYASAGQTSVIVPYSVAGKTSTQVTVSKDGVVSTAQSVAVVPTQLGLFSANSSGSGQGALLNQDNSINSASNPAKRGSIVILYGTGEGVTAPAGVDGQLALSVYPKPSTPVSVKIGGRDAEVLYYGAAPTLVAGVLQLNVRVPAGLADGNQPIQLTSGTRQSPAIITLAIAGDQ